MIEIPETHQDLLEKPIIVVIGTVSPDGQPHTAAVWRYFDGEHILIETGRKSKKYRNISQNPNVSIIAVDPDMPYRYLEIRGVVEAMPSEGALELLDQLSMTYLGKEKYFGGVVPKERQAEFDSVVLTIKPTHAATFG